MAAQTRRYSFLRFQPGVDWRDVRPALLNRLNRLGAGLGEVITVTSGYRSAAEQAALSRNHQNPYPVAAPGHSLHQRGLAVDAVINGRPISDVVSDPMLRKYGLSTPVGNDPVHVQLYGASSAAPSQHLTGLQAEAAHWAQVYHVPVGMMLAQVMQESGWDPKAGSNKGAEGIAQFEPATWNGLMKRYGLSGSPTDPHLALQVMARYMGGLIHQYGDVRDALSVYNSGKPWAQGQGIGETNHYVNTILNNASQGAYGAGMQTGAQMAGNQYAAQAQQSQAMSDAQSSAQAVDQSVGNLSPEVQATLPGIYGPGTISGEGQLPNPQQAQQTWQLLASQPLASTETQQIAQRIMGS